MKALKETHPCTKFMKSSPNLIAVDITGSGTKGKVPGGVLGSIFAWYVPLASQNSYPIIVYSLANY